MKVKASCFGKRFCTYCGKTNMHYYTWKVGSRTYTAGECTTKGCTNQEWCDNESPEAVKDRYNNTWTAPDYDVFWLDW